MHVNLCTADIYASLGEHDAPRFLILHWSSNGERDVEVVQTKSKHAMKQELGIKNEAVRMIVMPPLAVATRVHRGDMKWNRTTKRHQFQHFNPSGIRTLCT